MTEVAESLSNSNGSVPYLLGCSGGAGVLDMVFGLLLVVVTIGANCWRSKGVVLKQL